jgi:hypothetical protein
VLLAGENGRVEAGAGKLRQHEIASAILAIVRGCNMVGRGEHAHCNNPVGVAKTPYVLTLPWHASGPSPASISWSPPPIPY